MTAAPLPTLPPSAASTAAFAALAMVAFAGNSLLCRLALGHTGIDAASFTSIRLLSGALALWLLVRLRGAAVSNAGSWASALALFVYAIAFSLAYTQLTAATGALLLFGTVQLTMIGTGLWRGERLRPLQVVGLLASLAGLLALLLPGLSSPPLAGALLMAAAGVAWGIYSLRGRGTADATAATAGNFLRAVPMGLAVTALALTGAMPSLQVALDLRGVMYAVASGAIASGLGYAVWYTVLPRLTALRASVIQLSVPVIAAIGGSVLIGEPLTLRLALCSLAILGGVALVIATRAKAASTR